MVNQTVEPTESKRNTGKPSACLLQRCRVTNRQSFLLLLLLLLLFATAAGIRLHKISDPPLDYHPNRQYASAQGARTMYYLSSDTLTEWQEDILRSLNPPNTRIKFPLPTIEGIAFLLYKVAGGEYLWLPRVFSALSFVLGAVFLYLIAKRVTTRGGALCATAFYLFLPFGILASRSFQSEPLMVAAMLFAVWTVVLHAEKPTRRRALIAGLATAAAILIRPVCGFMIFGAFAGLALARQGPIRPMKDPGSWLFAGVAVLPTVALSIYDRLHLGGAGAAYVEEVAFVPRLLITPSFYLDWLMVLVNILGTAFPLGALALLVGLVLLAAVVGALFILRKGPPRALVLGLLCGYLVSGLVFNFHIHTHNYFSLQFVPLAALCLGSLAVWLVPHSYTLAPRLAVRGAIAFALIVVCLTALAWTLARVSIPNADQQVRAAESIGEIVDHSKQTIVLSQYYGRDTVYHGWFIGSAWPATYELEARSKLGRPDVRGEELFYDSYWDHSPEYFIVTYLADFERQADIREFLLREFPILAETDDYIIFDLRQTDMAE